MVRKSIAQGSGFGVFEGILELVGGRILCKVSESSVNQFSVVLSKELLGFNGGGENCSRGEI